MIRSFLALTLLAPAAFAAEWKPLDTAEFSVSLPGTPERSEQTDPSEIGPVKTTTWGLKTPTAFYAVSLADYPTGKMSAAVPSQVLVGARNGAMVKSKATIEKDSVVYVEAIKAKKRRYEGREFIGMTETGVLPNPDGGSGTVPREQIRMAARLFLVEDRLYQMICVSTKTAFSDADFRQFVDSFRLNKPAPLAPAAGKKK